MTLPATKPKKLTRAAAFADLASDLRLSHPEPAAV